MWAAVPGSDSYQAPTSTHQALDAPTYLFSTDVLPTVSQLVEILPVFSASAVADPRPAPGPLTLPYCDGLDALVTKPVRSPFYTNNLELRVQLARVCERLLSFYYHRVPHSQQCVNIRSFE